ncbi:hypothetical protein GE061_000368 [Apolygus lucorum]|uniref:CCHC-type domain-containing protein n=1 Tax=Apolygus lucorum TaxID=248454 RepID=A0A6A4KBM1_APOLU|nr:hypothetical protein GE061_000368 [Apolygus lucorum]
MATVEELRQLLREAEVANREFAVRERQLEEQAAAAAEALRLSEEALRRETATTRRVEEMMGGLAIGGVQGTRPPRKDLGLQSLVKPWSGGSDSLQIEEFIAKLREVGNLGGWDSADLACICRLKLQGTASAFLEGQELLRETRNFEVLVRGLVGRFTDPFEWKRREGELRKLSQKPKETLSEFADRATTTGRRAVRLGESEEETAWLHREGRRRTLEAFIHGVRGEVGRQLTIEQPDTLERALTRALAIEAGLKRRAVEEEPKRMLPTWTDEVETQEGQPLPCGQSDSRICVAAQGRGPSPSCTCGRRREPLAAPTPPPLPLGAQPYPPRLFRCYRCNTEGHIARYCPYPPPMGNNPEYSQPRPPQGGRAREGPSGPPPLMGLTLPPRPMERCFHCNEMGHIARYCPRGHLPCAIEAAPKETGPQAARLADPRN